MFDFIIGWSFLNRQSADGACEISTDLHNSQLDPNKNFSSLTAKQCKSCSYFKTWVRSWSSNKEERPESWEGSVTIFILSS